MTPTVERIQNLFLSNNKVPAQVFKQLGMPQNALSIWKNGKANPSTEAIIKISNYFAVTTDYLLTGKIQESDLCKSEINLIQLYRSLPEPTKERVMGYVEGCLETIKEKVPD